MTGAVPFVAGGASARLVRVRLDGDAGFETALHRSRRRLREVSAGLSSVAVRAAGPRAWAHARARDRRSRRGYRAPLPLVSAAREPGDRSGAERSDAARGRSGARALPE